jgi:tetratricopeptide (TPR) repeat protein
MQKPPIKHNPAFLGDADLVRAFVVRYDDLALVLQVVRENTRDSNQHVLVVGPRGIGKTMLVRRAALEVQQDEELRQLWYPLIFAEESYEVGSAGEFWLESLFHLAQQTGDAAWRRTYDDLKKEPVEDRLRERALAQLMDFADRQRKRVLLIVENLNQILGDQISDDDAWKLRHTLMHESRLMLLATATARPDSLEATHKAMFELFKTHTLQPLNDEECQAVWRSATGAELGPRRIRAISILTGGNPRLLAIISHFGARLSFAELMQDMTGLVDEHTDYFKSHLDALPPTERKAYVALADLWDPSTARQVAAASRLEVSKTSALLNRLIGRGAVVEAPGKGRTKRYQVAERMYNIYYLMRRRGSPSERVRAVVQFMVQFYGRRELVEVTRRLAEEACHLPREERRSHYSAYECILRAVGAGARSRILARTPPTFLRAPDRPASLGVWLAETGVTDVCPCDLRRHPDERVRRLMEQGRLAAREARGQDAEQAFREAAGIDPAYAEAWVRLGLILEARRDGRVEAEAAFRKASEAAPDCPCAWYHLGRLLSESSDRRGEAEQAFRKALALYPDCSDAWEGLAHLVGGDAGRESEVQRAYQEAENACIRRAERFPDHARTWRMLAAIRLWHTGRPAEAETAYRKAIELDPQDAPTWASLGNLLGKYPDRHVEAEAAYRKAIELNPQDARAWAWLGNLLGWHPDRHVEAEAAYRKAIELNPQDAWAWACLGNLLGEHADRHVEAEAAYRKAIELNPQDAWAWAWLGNLLGKHPEREVEAEAAYAKAIELDPQYAWAWVCLGHLLGKHPERHVEAEAAYRKAIELDPQYAWAWVWLGNLLGWHPEREVEAEAAYAKAIELDPQYACAWVCLGHLLGKHPERHVEAEAAYRKAIELNPQDAWAWAELTKLVLIGLNQSERALGIARQAVGAVPGDPVLLNELAYAFYSAGPADLLAHAEEWARKAVELGGCAPHVHTLTCVLARAGKEADSLAFSGRLLDDAGFVGSIVDDMVTLFAELVAAGSAEGGLKLLRESRSLTALEPVAVALQMHLGKEVHVAPEIARVAQDVLKRFESVRQRRRQERAGGP